MFYSVLAPKKLRKTKIQIPRGNLEKFKLNNGKCRLRVVRPNPEPAFERMEVQPGPGREQHKGRTEPDSSEATSPSVYTDATQLAEELGVKKARHGD